MVRIGNWPPSAFDAPSVAAAVPQLWGCIDTARPTHGHQSRAQAAFSPYRAGRSRHRPISPTAQVAALMPRALIKPPQRLTSASISASKLALFWASGSVSVASNLARTAGRDKVWSVARSGTARWAPARPAVPRCRTSAAPTPARVTVANHPGHLVADALEQQLPPQMVGAARPRLATFSTSGLAVARATTSFTLCAASPLQATHTDNGAPMPHTPPGAWHGRPCRQTGARPRP